ncbi:MAG: hypothetical protein CO186_10020 [Zetaproteobacteria bacterium CG_4_9_14_3_um_filter_49_83]|nr:MAG: hypothetical protein AUJ56_03060 [Zetaproteobacteria bacterium CG1_02_49_23]PIQ34523.1 MAG: hypothetical protein COW62_01605 [Zetaproteobacteria bacterium CG17_big_fil_post_rev_8_21_14_2_50_50_13]PIV31663.1 MAG: hypothetical protein COS35_00230 [Zetaproteobacteria bacterium CG02_land_8_20_14_3_00_50_9]PIY55346.1 MAG: hypothetical protein COZ00_10020 [Zetaproteobacteria bacterium CG_4_10_14_0_8_um_filter_49_80]PJA34489.1 MAG: hypothetical protein CO186_10020 [Zetaproteobacteria bacterium
MKHIALICYGAVIVFCFSLFIFIIVELPGSISRTSYVHFTDILDAFVMVVVKAALLIYQVYLLVLMLYQFQREHFSLQMTVQAFLLGLLILLAFITHAMIVFGFSSISGALCLLCIIRCYHAIQYLRSLKL